MDQTAAGALVEVEGGRLSSFWANLLARLAIVAFVLWLTLGLSTPSWRYGPFSWWPLLKVERLGGGPLAVGPFMLLPALAAGSWFLSRLVSRTHRAWRWGRPEVTLPLLGLTVLGMATLDPMPTRRTVLFGGSLVIVWFVLLFLMNERPTLTFPLSVVMILQSSVAIGQFFWQREIGLAAFGELPLDPTVEGIAVLQARGHPWLRAYGLTTHPNMLGAMLAALWLLLLPAYLQAQGWRRRVLALVLAVGLGGLLVSFSRASWLAFASALVFWAALGWRRRPSGYGGIRWWRLLIVALPGLLFLFSYRDLVWSRFLRLDTTIEAESLANRVRDAELALQLAAANPWKGVGLGAFHRAALALNEEASLVHNVPLLVAAELGLPALFLWASLVLAPFVRRRRQAAARLAPWLLLIVVGLFDITLWWGHNWQTAMLFALLAARVCRPTAGDGEAGRGQTRLFEPSESGR